LLWARRRERWRRLSRRQGGLALGVGLLLGSVGLLLWSRLTGVGDVAIQSLALLGLGLAALQGRPAGARVASVPTLFLLLALSPSPAAVNELFWLIQVHSTRAAAAVIEGLGRPVLVETVILTTPVQTFAVIESCASLGVMVVLLAAALLLRERLCGSVARNGLVLAAIPLALALNLLRIVTIVLWPDVNRAPHLVQWAVLIGLGIALLSRLARTASRGPAPPPDAAPSRPVAPRLVVPLAALALLSLVPQPARRVAPLGFFAANLPLEHAGWSGRDVAADRPFLGWVRFREIVSRDYRRGDDRVVLFVGLDDSRARTASPFSSKTLLPGFKWVELASSAEEGGRAGDAQTAIVARESNHWWVAQWRLGYHGMWGEALRHALALDASPFTEVRQRAVVRLRVPLAHNDPREGAAESAERFLADFRGFLPLPAGAGGGAGERPAPAGASGLE
jgi:exosortase/archaeosortase family protein